jgi:integrase/recombinase XerD
MKEEYLQRNIASKVEVLKVHKKILKSFTVEEVEAVIEAFTNKTYLEVRKNDYCYVSGRVMEIRGLKAENVKETSILVHGKGN